MTHHFGCIDYEETFALIAKMNSIRVLFVAANLDCPLHQFNVKNAFLHGDVGVYMDLDLKIRPLWEKFAN
jgi:hypothetical protein